MLRSGACGGVEKPLCAASLGRTNRALETHLSSSAPALASARRRVAAERPGEPPMVDWNRTLPASFGTPQPTGAARETELCQHACIAMIRPLPGQLGSCDFQSGVAGCVRTEAAQRPC